MEIPDVIVVNKADHPLTDTMIREIRGVLSLANLDGSRAAARWRVPIVKTEATHGRGIDELAERLEEHRAHLLAAGELEAAAGATCATRCSRSPPRACAGAWRRSCSDDPEFQDLLERGGAAAAGSGERGRGAAGVAVQP